MQLRGAQRLLKTPRIVSKHTKIECTCCAPKASALLISPQRAEPWKASRGFSTPVPTVPTLLCVLDGFGYREKTEDNAIALAKMPNWNSFWSSGPRALLQASEEEVGLPKKQIGNSEVGHMNIGSGRIIQQDILQIDRACEDKSLLAMPQIKLHTSRLLATRGVSHVMGLVSEGGVHSHQNHIVELARAINNWKVPVAIHAFTDGRDVPPQDAARSMKDFLKSLEGLQARVVTVNGRYFAMDRDNRWERVKVAYDAIVSANGLYSENPLSAIQEAYSRGETDEFIKPTVLKGYTGIRDGDGIFFANFRADRARQLLSALVDPTFKGFKRSPRMVNIADACGLVEYGEKLNNYVNALFGARKVEQTLGELVSSAGLNQLRIAETEKYPHVTFFFNGGREQLYKGEDRILVQSPKVATYDLKPEMSAYEVTDKLVDAINSGKYGLLIVNFANPDMVGHTGKLDAAIKAVEAVDTCLGRLATAIKDKKGQMIITADHGNCELMKDPETGEPHTAHTLNPVPVVLVNGKSGSKLRDGRLCDIAPTILELMKLPQPSAMTGESLLRH